MATKIRDQRTIIRVVTDVMAGNEIVNIASKHGVNPNTAKEWISQHSGCDLDRMKLKWRWDHIARLPSVESQLMEFIEIMVESERFCPEGRLLPTNLWLGRSGFEVYFRWARWREIGGKRVLSLDLASISIPEKFRGRGWFRSFVQLLLKVSPTDGIFIEQASQDINPWMKDTLLSWGFQEVSPENYWFDLAARRSGARL